MSTIEEFRELERKGREKAYNRDQEPLGDIAFLKRVSDAATKMAVYFEKLGMPIKYSKMADYIDVAASWAIEDVEPCIRKGIPRKDCIIAKTEDTDWVDAEGRRLSFPYSIMGALDRESKAIYRRRCTYLHGEIDPYNESAFLNDLTSCFHRLLDTLEEKAKKWHITGKCMWRVPV